jgi:hypothetical protein
VSLHAVVYKRLDNVPEEIRELVRIVDPSSGETEFIADELEARYSLNRLLAADVALGNSAMILWLANAIEKECAGKCQTLSKAFLYSGSHSGDFIPLSEVIKIKNELETARLAAPQIETGIRELAEKVSVLVSAAMTEGNPIVFT